MIDFPIVDAHVHVWDTSRLRYAWLAGIPLLNRPYLLADFDEARGPVPVERIVFVQAEVDHARYAEETAWVTRLAEADPRLQGIVSWAPLEQGDAARPDLEKLAANRLVKGVRRLIQTEESGFCLRADFVRGVRALADYGLSFDLGITHRQLADSIRLVEQCPGVQFVLDHLGKPDIAHRVLDPWQEELRTLAGFPNVWCKVSGLVTEADSGHWTNEDLRPYIDHALECFGFARVLYGGDWPVVLLASEYPRWVEALAWAVAGYSDRQRRRLFHDNAIACYRLG